MQGNDRRAWFLLTVAAVIVGVIVSLDRRGPSVTADTVPATVMSSTGTSTVVRPVLGERLQSPLEEAVARHPDLTIGVSVIDVATGEQVAVHGDQSMVAASTTKLLAAARYLTDTELNGERTDAPLGDNPARDQLYSLVNQSDNDVWVQLVDWFGHGALNDYAHQLGLNRYNAEVNQWSANDMAKLLTQLARGTLLSAADRAWLLGAMTQTNDESLIPAALPEGVAVHHKYGRFEGAVNDGAIIDVPGRQLVLVIMTQSSDQSEGQGEAAIHEITRLVFP